MSNGKHVGGDQLLLGQRHITPFIFLNSSLGGAVNHKGKTSIAASWQRRKQSVARGRVGIIKPSFPEKEVENQWEE